MKTKKELFHVIRLTRVKNSSSIILDPFNIVVFQFYNEEMFSHSLNLSLGSEVVYVDLDRFLVDFYNVRMKGRYREKGRARKRKRIEY